MSILTYHMIDPKPCFAATRIHPKQFERQIEMAANMGFVFQTISDYLWPQQKHEKRLAITFDDGYDSVFKHALPILKQYNAPATVFVNPGYVGQFNTWDVNFLGMRTLMMSWPQLQHLSKTGWEIGSHGMTHQDLTCLPRSKVMWELNASRVIIHQQLGICSPVFSFPFGNANADAALSARECGYTAGVLMNKPKSIQSNKFFIPRLGVYFFDTLHSCRNKMLAKNKTFHNLIQKMIGCCSNSTVLVKRHQWSMKIK